MTEGGKNTIKKKGDHNWDMERMQFQKAQGNVSGGTDYINMNSKGNDINGALGDILGGDRQITNTDSTPIPGDGSRHKSPQKGDNS
jgi:hypothetical protein